MLRVGVVGVGALGQHHARVYASLPDVSLVGVVDVRPGRAEEIARPLGTKAFQNYTDLFGKVDAVSIATPTTLHAEIGAQFLKEGVHVLVEKPIAHTLKDADLLIDAAKENSRILQVGHLERFNPAVRSLREIVRKPRFFEAHRMGLFSPRSLDIDVILDLMIHDLDIICLLVRLAGDPGQCRWNRHSDQPHRHRKCANSIRRRLRRQCNRQPRIDGKNTKASTVSKTGIHLARLLQAGCFHISASIAGLEAAFRRLSAKK